jgi:hypothetical protein
MVLPLGSELKIKALKKYGNSKMAGADIKCLYVKTSKSDVTKDMIKSGKILKRTN